MFRQNKLHQSPLRTFVVSERCKCVNAATCISDGAVNNTGTAVVHKTDTGCPPTTAAVPLNYRFVSRKHYSARCCTKYHKIVHSVGSFGAS